MDYLCLLQVDKHLRVGPFFFGGGGVEQFSGAQIIIFLIYSLCIIFWIGNSLFNNFY